MIPELNNEDKIILHLCATEGSDSKPYRDAGYQVILVGEDIGVENFHPPENVYGIIANPPCTMFSIARTIAKSPRDLQEGMRLVKECLRVIWECQYRISENQHYSPLKFWALENPGSGFLRWFLGRPAFEYCQSEYGAPLTKRTALWGDFNLPKRPLLFAQLPGGSSIGSKRAYALGLGPGKMQEKSRCPIDFALAFFEANP